MACGIPAGVRQQSCNVPNKIQSHITDFPEMTHQCMPMKIQDMTVVLWDGRDTIGSIRFFHWI